MSDISCVSRAVLPCGSCPRWETLLTALDSCRALRASLAHATSADMWAAQLPLAASIGLLGLDEGGVEIAQKGKHK